MRKLARPVITVTAAAVVALAAFAAEQTDLAARWKQMSAAAEARGLAEPFKGVTTNGALVSGLFPIRSTGVSTEPVQRSAEAFIASLTEAQRSKTLYAVDDDEWRKWMNPNFYVRQGMSFGEMSEAQAAAALALLRTSLSAKGLKLTRDIMKLDHTLGELNQNNFTEYGEGRYWLTVMGKPSATEPWGWQLDGHHLIVNYFVLRDQVVMTPAFWGAEPVIATSGKYKGTAILQQEQNDATRMLASLTDEQRRVAVLNSEKTANNNLAEAFKDNLVLDYAGVGAKTFSAAQKKQLLALIALYVNNMDEGHARVRMDEVAAHIDATHFAWIGGSGPDAVFYYRIHSPVILIEFDHQTPVGMRHLVKPGVPNREHIHSVVRTPNGNDYGKDLLRQHYEQHPHPH
jgi:hypothetical protein